MQGQCVAIGAGLKGPGRKPLPETEVRVKALHEEKSRAEQERDDWKTKCEVMKTLLDLYRQYDVEIAPTQGKKKNFKVERQKKPGSVESLHSGSGSKKGGDTP